MRYGAAVEIASLRGKVRLAVAALERAHDDVSGWAAYADEYFQAKHGLSDDLAAIETAIAALDEAGS